MRRCLPAVLGSLLLALTAPPAAAAEQAPPSDGGTVRLVVRTSTAAAGAAVADAAVRGGARPAGRTAELRAVVVEVPAAGAGALRGTLGRRTDVTSVEVAHRRWLTEEPADPRLADQRTYLDAIRATTAWGRPAHGAADVRIAVVDSGADVTHPDLAGKIAGTYDALTGGRDVRDLIGHGTAVASVAAAGTGNGVGIAGAGYDSTLLVAKVAGRTGQIFTDDVAAGVVWAVDSGATVINLSLGGPTTDRLERDAIAYARRHGVVVVAAAGNEGTSRRQFPAAHPGVLAVGASTASGAERAPFSSFGPWVDVAAPGRDILTATPGGGYERTDGTSFSAPLVAGEVALLAAYRPGRTADELTAAVVEGANDARLGFTHGLVDFDSSLDLLPPASTPVLVAPPAGTAVTGTPTVTVTSAAPRVRLTFGDLSAVVATTAGTAAAGFETFGLAGPQPVTATDCSTLTQCAATATSSTVVVANGAPALTSPRQGSAVTDDTVHAAALVPGGAVRFRLDGVTAATDTSPPYAAELSTAGLPDGEHTVSALLCRSDGSVCDTSVAADSVVTVARLHPSISAVTPRLFSPGNDGRRDRTTMHYRLDRRQDVTLRVRTTSGRRVLARPLGSLLAGAHSVAWDGRDSDGARVPSGAYTLELSTNQADGPLVGRAARTVRVDRTAPVLASRTPATVLPYRDGYRDTTRVSTAATERLRRLRLVVTTTTGEPVRTVRVGARAAGTSSVRWDGRTDGGRAVAPAAYRLRWHARDHASNAASSRPSTVEVSGQRLVRRSGARTVTARGSLTAAFTDDCSLVFRHSRGRRAGWIGYESSALCRSEDAFAAADHQVRLPKAVRYGPFRVTAYGGRADPRHRDAARVVYYDGLQNLSEHSFRLAPEVGTHRGPRVPAAGHLIRSRVLRWQTYTTGLAAYDVRSYTIRFSYDVLR